MAATHPKLRRDLVVSLQNDPTGTVFVVKDPVTARFFRLREPEFRLAEQLDGATPADTARQVVARRFGAAIAPETCTGFIDRLRTLGLLETPEARVKSTARLRGNVFYLRLKAFDPDRFFERLVPRTTFLFTPQFLLGSAALVLLAVAICAGSWDDLARDTAGLYRFQALFLAWCSVLAVTAAHECAHGLTCKRFGGRVHEVGLLLVYFQPALYCNVSDAWLFPERSHRLWVMFAGAYLDLCVWALATIAWRITESGTVPSYLALVVMASCVVKTFFNLNPLLKLDGYYLLSDWLELPNLRQRALAYLRDRLMPWRSVPGVAAPLSRREGRVYLLYGLVATAYSTWFLWLVASYLAGALVARYQAWGFLIFAFGTVAMARRPLGRGVARLRDASRKGRAALPPPRKTAALLVGTGVALALLFFGRLGLRVTGDFRILPLENTDVRAEVDGIIEQVDAEEGQTVERGAVIARLSDRDLRAESRQLAAEIDEKRARLRMLEAGPRAEEIAVATAAEERAEERLRYGRSHLERLAQDPQLVSRKEFDEAREEVGVRSKELDEARGRLRLLLAGSRREEREAIQAEIARLEAAQALAEEHLRLLVIVSPRSGVVTTPHLRERVGQHVARGDLIAKVHEVRRVRAEIAISEKDISDVRVGQPVVLKVRAYPAEAFEGEVATIAPAASRDDDVMAGHSIRVLTEIANPSLMLKPGMTGTAKIQAGERRLVDLLTRRLARYVRVEFWSWW